MLVSVITPSFNQGRYLEETILSVLSQNYSDIEYIVIDGGSSDNSKEIILKYADHISYWISEPDSGQAEAINKGFRRSTGDLICWINSDDILYPDFVKTRVRQFNENPDIDFIYGDIDQGIDLSHKTLRKGTPTNFKTMLLTLNVPIPQQSTMWRRKIMREIGILDTRWHVILDWEYFMRISKNCKILYQSGSVAFFRNHETSKSVTDWRKWLDELEKYYQNLFSGLLPSDYLNLKSKALSAMYFECAKICEANSDYDARYKYLSLARRSNGYTYKKNYLFSFLRNKRHQIIQWFYQ